MGLLPRIGSFLRTTAQRIGQINVAGALNRIGAVASAASKLGSLANAVSGGGLKMAAESYLGPKVTKGIVGGVGYVGRAWDQAQLTKAALNASRGPQMTGGGAGGALEYQGGTKPKAL